MNHRALTIMVMVSSLLLPGCGARQPQAKPPIASPLIHLRHRVARQDPSVQFIAVRPLGRPQSYEPSHPTLFILTPDTPAKSLVVLYTAVVPQSSTRWTVDGYEASQSRPHQLILMSRSTISLTSRGLTASTRGIASSRPVLKFQLLPPEIRTGATWASPLPGQTGRSTILGVANITTAAGHYQHCLVVFQQNQFTGAAHQHIVYVNFLAPHLGEVKQVSWWASGPIPQAFQLRRVVPLPDTQVLGHSAIPTAQSGWPLVAPWQS